jgi:chromate reductase, NAD(P)H dehydrogenase (quinone)
MDPFAFITMTSRPYATADPTSELRAAGAVSRRSTIRILGIPGSVRRNSFNRRLLANAADLMPADVEFVIWNGLKNIPPYDQDDDLVVAPAAVARMRKDIAEANALLIATPEYNASIPGQLKNAIDWASRPMQTSVLRNKPVGVIGASTSAFGAVWAQTELRKVLATAGARVVGTEVPVARADERFDADGRLTDPIVRGQLAELVFALVTEATSEEHRAA